VSFETLTQIKLNLHLSTPLPLSKQCLLLVFLITSRCSGGEPALLSRTLGELFSWFTVHRTRESVGDRAYFPTSLTQVTGVCLSTFLKQLRGNSRHVSKPWIKAITAGEGNHDFDLETTVLKMSYPLLILLVLGIVLPLVVLQL